MSKKFNERPIVIAIFIIISIFPPKEFLKRYNAIDPSITLYRILGNDLPPLHSFNQTLTNLLFNLQNEPSFPSVSKVWILNRIVNKDKEKILIDTLNRYKQYFLRIPFIWDEYRQIGFHLPINYPKPDFFNSTEFTNYTSLNKLRLIDSLYHKKNLYAMNNNGARNFALRHGKQESRSDWLMVFDGNCFLSQQSYDLIRQSLLTNGSRFQYFIVPMIRLLDNNDIYHINATKAKDEPQIIFRRDSTIEYSEEMPYGQKSKVELLAYLGAMKHIRRLFEWLPKERTPIVPYREKHKRIFQETSFILRLSSGAHPANAQSMYTRGCSRLESVISFLKSLDFKITRRRVLPRVPIGISPQCNLWSDDEIRKCIEIVYQPKNMTL